MKWSWKLGKVFGITINLHFTFWILIGFIIWTSWSVGMSIGTMLEAVGFIIAIIGCVLLHEFGHALMASRYGINTQEITLLPIGGVARLERMPEKPWHELWMALAGPSVNVFIAVAIFAWPESTWQFTPLEQLSVTSGPFCERLLLFNLILIVFNIVPTYPMDGGRVLRALLATKLEYTRAVKITANVGQGVALLFAILGLFGDHFFLFIALFVFIGVGLEASQVTMRAALGGIRVRQAMIPDCLTLRPCDSLQRAVELSMSTQQRDFPITENSRVIGILTSRELMLSMELRGPDIPIKDAMCRDFLSVDENEMLDRVMARMDAVECCSTAAVFHGDELVGILTSENIRQSVITALSKEERYSLDVTAT